MNKYERKRWKQLERRVKWLESRVSVYSGKDPSYDEAELSALKWVMELATKQLAEELNK